MMGRPKSELETKVEILEGQIADLLQLLSGAEFKRLYDLEIETAFVLTAQSGDGY